MTFTKEELAAVEKAVAARRTFKVIGDVADPVSFDSELDERCRDLEQLRCGQFVRPWV